MKRIIYSVASLVLCAPLLAQAAEGWVVDDISLQAGPDPAYPSITELAAGTPVSIAACIDGWTWCDVIAGPDRGWVPGTFLAEDYGGERVVVIDYGPRIGIPVVGFSLALYWDQHYHNRPFYSQKETFVTRAIQPRAPQRASAAAVARVTTKPAAATKPTAATDQRMQTQPRTQAQPKSVAHATTTSPKRVEPANPATQSVATQAPQSAKEKTPQAQPATKPTESAPQTTIAKAKPRSGEPKPKDELQNPKSKQHNKTEEHDQGGGGER
jgi:uncharacterized protein YraI